MMLTIKSSQTAKSQCIDIDMLNILFMAMIIFHSNLAAEIEQYLIQNQSQEILPNIKKDPDWPDVTLAHEDRHQLQAHKVIIVVRSIIVKLVVTCILKKK